MKNKLTVIILALTAVSMVVLGLIYNISYDGVVCLKTRPNPANPEDYPDVAIHQVWLAKHPIKKNQTISTDDFVVAEQQSLTEDVVTVWIKRVEWVAATDFEKGQLLRESNLKAKYPRKLKDYLKNGFKLNPWEHKRVLYLKNSSEGNSAGVQ